MYGTHTFYPPFSEHRELPRPRGSTAEPPWAWVRLVTEVSFHGRQIMFKCFSPADAERTKANCAPALQHLGRRLLFTSADSAERLKEPCRWCHRALGSALTRHHW